MTIRNSVEYLYQVLMLRWEEAAPPDNHEGILDGEPVRNTQVTRMAYILRKIPSGNSDSVFRTLEVHTRRRDGKSYVSKDRGWMEQPYPLLDGWYFEGCTNLSQKQGILQQLTKVGLSAGFVACCDDFVAGNSIRKHLPTLEEIEGMVATAGSVQGSEIEPELAGVIESRARQLSENIKDITQGAFKRSAMS